MKDFGHCWIVGRAANELRDRKFRRHENFFSRLKTMSLPSYLHPQKVPSASANVSLIGLFVSKAIPAGEEAFRIDRPLVAVLDSTHLKDTCSNCHLWLAESGAYLDDGDAGERGKQKVKACLGCKVLKYCSKVSSLSL